MYALWMSLQETQRYELRETLEWQVTADPSRGPGACEGVTITLNLTSQGSLETPALLKDFYSHKLAVSGG